MRRAVVVAGAVIAVIAASAAPAAAQVGVDVHYAGGEQFVSTAPITSAADVHGAQYALRGAVGGTTVTQTNSGLSVGALLAGALPPSSPIGSVAIREPGNAGWSVLTPADLALPSDFQDPGLTPIVFVSNPDTVAFLRPLRGDGDSNPLVQSPSNTPLEIDVHAGAPLSVTDTPNTTHADVGEPVTFTASAPAVVGPLTFTWDFGDGTTATSAQPTITHQFTTSGSPEVLVSAGDAQDDWGAAPGVFVTVGSPAPGPDDSTGPPPAAPTTPPATPPATPAPVVDGSPVVTTKTPTPKPATHRHRATTRRRSATRQAPPSPPTPTGDAAAGVAAPAPSPSQPPSPATTRRHRSTPRHVAVTEPLVRGLLVSGRASAASTATARADRATATRAATSGAAGVAGTLTGAGLVAALIGAGALAEHRGRRRLRHD